MRIAITGSSGLLGQALRAALPGAGFTICPLVRTTPRPGTDEIFWNPEERTIDTEALDGTDAVVHLAGENLASGRWTRARKRRIEESRVVGTRLLAEALGRLNRKPRVLISMSGSSFYGNRGDERLNEGSAPGRGFLAELCQKWESAADPARRAGIRVVHLRTGIVLSRKGGALARMLPAFRAGLGAVLGDGNQYWPWIAIDDLVSIFQRLLLDETISGPVNVAALHAVTNRQFSETLASVLRRPLWLRVPRPVLRALLGEMADEALVTGCRIEPVRLVESGFVFRFGQLDAALGHLLYPPDGC